MQCEIDYFAFNPPKILVITQRRNQKRWRKYYAKLVASNTKILRPKQESQQQLHQEQQALCSGAPPTQWNIQGQTDFNRQAIVLLNRLTPRQDPTEGGDDHTTGQQPNEGGDTPVTDFSAMSASGRKAGVPFYFSAP